MVAGHTGWHDVGMVHHGPDLKAVRYFLNIAGAGFDGQVTRKVNAWTGLGKGTKWSYWLCILQELFRYRHTRISLTVDGQTISQVALTLAIGVCRYNGGGMMQLPEAQYDDGLLDASIIGSMSKAAMVRHLPDVVDGSFTRLEAVNTMRGKTFHLASEPGIWVEADGEIIGPAPVEISVRSKAFRVLLPPEH
jgi:diacylglycerol kinase family enzyme